MPHPTPLPVRLSEHLERLEALIQATAPSLPAAEGAALLALVRACCILWDDQRSGIQRARLALGYGARSRQLARLDRQARQNGH